MKIVFYLSTCSTCKRIMEHLEKQITDVKKQDIKYEKISPDQIDHMRDLAGSYEALFSRKAMKFRSMGLGDKKLSETDYRDLILEEYTFLKRPVFVLDDQIFIGSSKKVVEELSRTLGS